MSVIDQQLCRETKLALNMCKVRMSEDSGCVDLVRAMVYAFTLCFDCDLDEEIEDGATRACPSENKQRRRRKQYMKKLRTWNYAFVTCYVDRMTTNVLCDGRGRLPCGPELHDPYVLNETQMEIKRRLRSRKRKPGGGTKRRNDVPFPPAA